MDLSWQGSPRMLHQSPDEILQGDGFLNCLMVMYRGVVFPVVG